MRLTKSKSEVAASSKMASPKSKKIRPVLSPTASPWNLARRSFVDIWHHKKVLFFVVGIVELPSVILSLLASGNATSTNNVDAYTNLASIFMNVALVYLAAGWLLSDKAIRTKQAYYRSSTYVLRFLLATAAITIGLLPALIGLIVYAVAATATSAVGATPGELALIIGLSLFISLPSFWFLTRYMLGAVIVVTDNLNPVAALKRSRNLSLGRFWPVLGRYVFLLLMITVIGVAVGIPTQLVTVFAPSAGGFMSLLFGILFTFAALPYIATYLVRMHQDLAGSTNL